MRKFSATALYSGGDDDYLIVSPVGTVPGEGAYKGCAVFRFDRLDRAQIARDETRQPRLHNYVHFGQETFNGACTVVPEGPRAGLIMGEVEFARRAGSGIEPKFRIFATDQLHRSTTMKKRAHHLWAARPRHGRSRHGRSSQGCR
jgi:hypothetical protein